MKMHPDDDRFDDWLKEAAGAYHRPPAGVPRDEMWAVIQQARGVAAIPPVTSAVVELPRRSASHRWRFAAAAVLILGAGIGIGRTWRPAPARPADLPVASAPVAGGDAAARPLAAAGSPEASPPGRPLPEEAPAVVRQPRGGEGEGDPLPSSPSATYTLATVDHLSRAEALLTSFRSARGDSLDAPLDRWARDLLADTRLLLDSPAADDSRRRLLLEDLEMVLAQIVMLRAESSADRNLVRRSLEGGEVLSRIRSSIPAGVTSGT